MHKIPKMQFREFRVQGSGTKIKLSYSSLVRIGTTGSAHPGSNNHDNSPPIPIMKTPVVYGGFPKIGDPSKAT